MIGENLPAQPAVRVMRAADREAWQNAHAFLARAQTLLWAVEHEAEQRYERARLEGFKAGLSEFQQFEADWMASAETRLDIALVELRGQLADLAVSVVHQLIGRLPAEEVVVQITLRALNDVRGHIINTVVVNERNYDAMSAAIAENRLPAALSVRIEPELSDLQSVLCGSGTIIDTGIETRLSEIVRSLKEDGRHDG